MTDWTTPRTYVIGETITKSILDTHIRDNENYLKEQVDLKASLTGVETLTNKRVRPRVGTITSAATPTININTLDMFTITALATNITSMSTNLNGTPTEGQKFIIRIKDNGTPRSITWGSSYASRGATLPTTTVAAKTTYVGLIYNDAESTWDCIASVTEV